MHICNFRTQYGIGLLQTANNYYLKHFVFFVYLLCHFYAHPTRFCAWTIVRFSNNKFFSKNIKLLFQG